MRRGAHAVGVSFVAAVFTLLAATGAFAQTPSAIAVCATRPVGGCTQAHEAALRLVGSKDNAPHATRLLWKWLLGDATTADFGDPASGSANYRLCMYEDDNLYTRPQLLIEAGAAWHATSKGFRYATATPNASGVQRAILVAGTGDAAIVIKASGYAAGTLPLNARSLTLQFVKDAADGGECWESTFRPPYRSDTTKRFAAALRLDQVGSDGLEAYLPLDGNWNDATGHYDFVAANAGGFASAPQLRAPDNQAYGPTYRDADNGAVSDALVSLPEDNGITLDGWVLVPDNGTGGVVFGFGGGGWDEANLNVAVAWGFLRVQIGRQSDGVGLRYPRIGDNCWHHVALVLPRGFRSGARLRFYLDGRYTLPEAIDSSAVGGAALGPGATLWGSPFRAADVSSQTQGSGSGGNQKIDEVRVWTRALSSAEVRTLATATGIGTLCENSPPPAWAPGPRFVPPALSPTPALDLGVHVLTADTIAVVTDPNPWLKTRIAADCGAYLAAMEGVRDTLAAYFPGQEYGLAAKEVIAAYRPELLTALSSTSHFGVSGPGLTATFEQLSLWPQATREFRAPSFAVGGGEVHTDAAEVVYYSFLHLDAPMVSGASYAVTDEWGNTHAWVYDENRTISWALKVDQAGYAADSAGKYAYLGGWLGPNGGALDVARFDGGSFDLVRESDDAAVFSGVIAARGDESASVGGYLLSGERVEQLDFSSFQTPGRYYLRVGGLGRSWSFNLGADAMGESFYVHARGLFHQRCAPLPSSFTPWSRGDAHAPIYRASHPTEIGAYTDHSGEGWGFLDEAGKFPDGISVFAVIAATATTDVVSPTSGEWHDAGDFDRGGFSHLSVVEYLAEAYLMFPANFSDGQLSIPESGNGVPDILDEAVWGTDLWRRLQEADGRVPLWVEATSHPRISDPGVDTQPYYAGLATRDSSLEYAEHAARLSRALHVAGADARSELFLASAERAYAFAMTDYATVPRIAVTFAWNGKTITWKEPAAPDAETKDRALVQLWLATGDSAYYAALDTPAITTAFTVAAHSLYWRGSAFDFVDVALAPELFPSGWGTTASDEVLAAADDWVAGQATLAYRKLWHAVDHGYFPLMGWGKSEYLPILDVVAGWRLSGDETLRTAALNGVDWMQGANPQGRSLTTGLGPNSVVQPLHLPADSDGVADPVPGITIYGYTMGLPYSARTAVYGLFDDARRGDAFEGSALAQLPLPWNDIGLDVGEIGSILYAGLPIWRLLVTLENANVPTTEFAVAETVGPAAAVTGCLMEPGWTPSPELLARGPRSVQELRDALWYQP